MEDGNNYSELTDDKISITGISTKPDVPIKLPASNGHSLMGDAGRELDKPYSFPEIKKTNIDQSRRIKQLKFPPSKALPSKPQDKFNKSDSDYYNSIKKNVIKTQSIKQLNSKSPLLQKRNINPISIFNKTNDNFTLGNLLAKNNATKPIVDQRSSPTPVPKIIPKNQNKLNFGLLKKNKVEKGSQLKEYAQYLGLQPTVKFKCRKCCSMSFKSLGMLKDHQRSCRSQASDSAFTSENSSAVHGETGHCRVTRKVYLCSACGTYYENWNLFLHMREVHNRHICLFCLGMFSKAEKLAAHLISKHNVREYKYSDTKDFYSVYSGTLFLMCCYCDKIYTEKEEFSEHNCLINRKGKLLAPPLVHKPATKFNNDKRMKPINTNGPQIPKPPVTESDNVGPAKIEMKRDDVSSNIVNNNNTKIKIETSTCAPVKDVCMKSEDVQGTSKGFEHHNESNSDKLMKSVENNVATDQKESWPLAQPILPAPHPEASLEDISSANVHFNNKHVTEEKLNSHCHSTILQTNHLTEQKPIIKYEMASNSSDSTLPANKPPSRVRRPPKRYEKDPDENKSLFPKMNKVMLPTFDNKPEEIKSEPVNRVPKLTVRVPKDLIDKQSSSESSSDSEESSKLTLDIDIETVKEAEDPPDAVIPVDNQIQNSVPASPENMEVDVETKIEEENEPTVEEVAEIVSAGEDVPLTELTLDRPLDKYPLRNLLKVFLSSTHLGCIYCNHARKIAVNARQLALHFIAQHRFTATVDSITAEELMPETISSKVKCGLEELQTVFINLDSFDNVEKCEMKSYDHTYECFQCYFVTTIHKDLYFHNRKMHQKTILLCIMCKSNFYSYSELLCHLCPGCYDSTYEIKFRCCLCDINAIPSAFRLMVHLRKSHHACDVCLEKCSNQSKLSNHVWKHKLHHLCYRCGIAYRNKPDITKHLFWKHGTESVLCKKCLQKKWPHVYHFCVPPNSFICEECNLNFTKAVALKVHKRFHNNDYPHACTEEDCEEKFVSKKLLAKHLSKHLEPVPVAVAPSIEPCPEAKDIEQEESKEVEVSQLDTTQSESITEDKTEAKESTDQSAKSKKTKRKKQKDSKDTLLLDVNLPALNLSESDSSDDSESGTVKDDNLKSTEEEKNCDIDNVDLKIDANDDDKPDEQVLGIWDNFQQYQAEVEKNKEPAEPVKKHVCESDHDYCIIPTDTIEENNFRNSLGLKDSSEKKQKKKSPKKNKTKKSGNGSSSSSSSSSDSDSSCSCGSNCSCSSSSGSSSSSSSSDDSSDSGTEKKNKTVNRKTLSPNRDSDASHVSAVDVMEMEDATALIPEKQEIAIAESDLETEETETDEEFYDEHPQKLANKLLAEKRNQLMLLASVAPFSNGSIAEESSRPNTPPTEKPAVSKKKSKTKKRKKLKLIKKPEPLKINIPKEVIAQSEPEPVVKPAPVIHNKITISLQSNTVQIPDMPPPPDKTDSLMQSVENENKRASKRRRVPNKFYGYSSDEEYVLKPQQPPKLEWRKEDLPSPTNSHRSQTYVSPIPLLTIKVPEAPPPPPPIQAPVNPIISSDEETDSSEEGALKIVQPPVNIPPKIYPEVPTLPPVSIPTSSHQFPFPRPSGFRQAREGESVYCYCRCPYDEVSEMIACDADGCSIEWFHFECVGIMVPPKGKWYCPDCRLKQGNIMGS